MKLPIRLDDNVVRCVVKEDFRDVYVIEKCHILVCQDDYLIERIVVYNVDGNSWTFKLSQ